MEIVLRKLIVAHDELQNANAMTELASDYVFSYTVLQVLKSNRQHLESAAPYKLTTFTILAEYFAKLLFATIGFFASDDNESENRSEIFKTKHKNRKMRKLA